MKIKYAVGSFVLVFVCLVQASAQSARTYISAHGSDNTDCGSLALPCLSFSYALPKTYAGGEVIALDTGIYDDNIVITKSVTLAAAPGAQVEISNNDFSSPRIFINAQKSDTVVLRNLYLSVQGDYANDGISVLSVGTLQVENCVIDGFGIRVTLNAAGYIYISDTTVRNSSGYGIEFNSSAGVTRASVEHCRLENNGRKTPYGGGLGVNSNAKVTVRDTIAAGNYVGFDALLGDLNIEHCEASNNTSAGVIARANEGPGIAAVTISNSIVTNNPFGFAQSGNGLFHSLGNNVVRRNGTNTSGTITVISGT